MDRFLAISLFLAVTAKGMTPPTAGRLLAPIPSAKSIAEMVPKRGKLGERELTLMAIAHRPELERLRGAINTAKAQKRAAHDLENPEFRYSYAEDNDNRVSLTKKMGNSSGRDDTWAGLLRFRLPHPWERKARVQRAAAEISLAEAEYYAGEDAVVRKVCDAFQELAILQGKLASQNLRKSGFESYRDWIEKQKVPKLGLDLASARVKVYNTLSDVRNLESSIEAMRNDLAAFCGLADASRIENSSKIRRISDPSTLDVEYLTSIAMLYRSDVLGDQARLAIARAELAEVKARRIPFSTYVDVGYRQTNSLGRTGLSEEWFARVGVSIPLWEWIGFNKQHTVHETASQSLERQIEMQHQVISTEVSHAVKLLVAAEAQLSIHDKDLSRITADMKKSMADAQIATLDLDDFVKAARIEQEFKDLTGQMELSRYSSIANYQEALMALEKALGIRLERALSQTAEP
jgi:outer membrane protein TolC